MTDWNWRDQPPLAELSDDELMAELRRVLGDLPDPATIADLRRVREQATAAYRGRVRARDRAATGGGAVNGLSLFSGIGGLDLGVERAGIITVGQVEIDPWCRRVLAKHWPDVPRHDDVRSAADWWLSEERPHVDLVFGGFPCQDISNAGRRVGIGGERSGLWCELHNIVRLLRPRWVLLENVAAILARGAGQVLGELAEIGYDAEWDCIPAASVGAPHLRDRWFAIAYPQRDPGRLQPVAEPGSVGPAVAGDHGAAQPLAHADCSEGRVGAGWWEQQSTCREASGLLADTSGEGRQRSLVSVGAGGHVSLGSGEALPGGWSQPRRVAWWDVEPDVGRVAHGVPGRVDRLRGLGNAVVPQVAEHVGRLIVAADAQAVAS